MSLAWGGYANGLIPVSALATVPNFSPLGLPASTAAGSNLMRADAARQLSGMMQAFYKEFGVQLSLSEGNRGMSNQNWYYNRFMKKLPGWTLAAFPGTSIHGWALSADLNVNGANPSGKYLEWLKANAHLWGFVNDVTTEPWHWSYRTDLVRQSITIAAVITNPQAGTANNSASPEANQGDEGVDRLIRNKKTGSIDWINTATGFHWYTPNMDYVNIIKGEIGRDVEDKEDNIHAFLIQMCDTQRDRLGNSAAIQVWTTIIDGWNGKQQAMNRLTGGDQKSGTLTPDAQKALVQAVITALPATAGGTVSIDQQKLAESIATILAPTLIKGVGDDFAARMKA